MDRVALTANRLLQKQFIGVATAAAMFLAISDPVLATVTTGPADPDAPDGVVIVRIPPSIMPSAPTFYVPPGSRIYVVKGYSRYTHSMVRGIPHIDSADDPSIVGIENTKMGVVVLKRDGSIARLDPNMDVKQDAYFTYVVHPGQRIALAVRGLAPTLIAP